MEDMFPTSAESEPEGDDQAFVDAVSWDWGRRRGRIRVGDYPIVYCGESREGTCLGAGRLPFLAEPVAFAA